MKRLIFLAVVFSFVVWAGCSSSDSPTDPGNGGPTGPPRVVANDTIGAPTLISTDEAVWSFVTKYAIDISTLYAPKLVPPASLNAPDSVYVQVIIDGVGLYLRVEWRDDSLNLLKDYMVTRDANANFTISRFSQEDQIYVMFFGLPDSAYDVWNWRSLTTGTAGVAEGFVFDNNSLIVDSGSQQVAFENFAVDTTRPQYVHVTGASYTGQILYKQDRDSFGNHIAEFNQPGLVVPGWWVDDSVGIRVATPQYAQSRWDVFTVHSHNSSTNRMAVVLRGSLNSPYSDDLILVDSVKVKIGVFDDQSKFDQGGSRRGFTQEFWLIL